jgi:NAD(P)-dependent dehydrogenase (short-subunit alcohol dehydrogenase family)
MHPRPSAGEPHVPSCERLQEEFGRLDVLVNNAAEHHVSQTIEEITGEQLERTFRTNIFAYFFMAKAALPYLEEGASIINTCSVSSRAQRHPRRPHLVVLVSA